MSQRGSYRNKEILCNRVQLKPNNFRIFEYSNFIVIFSAKLRETIRVLYYKTRVCIGLKSYKMNLNSYYIVNDFLFPRLYKYIRVYASCTYAVITITTIVNAVYIGNNFTYIYIITRIIIILYSVM